MHRDIVEVAVRFGDTLLDVTHVDATGVFRIGTAPDVDLAVPGYTSFPLVAQGKIRIPTGAETSTRGRTTVLRLGQVTIELARTRPIERRLALRRPQWRTPAFVVGSLLVHLAILIVAFVRAPFERLVEKHPPRLRYVHIATPSLDEPPPPPKPKPAEAAAAAASAPKRADAGLARGAAASRDKPGRGPDIDQVLDGLAKDVDKKLAGLRAEDQYDEDADNAKRFGGTGRFDPSQRPGFESVASGNYETMSVDIKTCPDKSCRVAGPFPLSGVRSYVHAHLSEIYGCYERFANGPGTIVLDFTISGQEDGGGSVRDAKGRGLAETGPCAAEVIAAVNFKAMDDGATRVRFSIRFN